MIAGVIDTPNQTTLYLNGEYFETLKSAQIPVVQIGSAMIGAWDKETSTDQDAIRNLSGRLDELMIFQNALTSEEIKRIYEAGKPWGMKKIIKKQQSRKPRVIKRITINYEMGRIREEVKFVSVHIISFTF